MYMKFQPSDTNYLHIFNSNNTTTPQVGISLNKKNYYNIKQQNQQHKQVVIVPSNGGKLAKKQAFHSNKNPCTPIVDNGEFKGTLGTQVNGKNRVFMKDKASNDVFVQNPDGRIEKKGGLSSGVVGFDGIEDGLCSSSSSSASKFRGNGVFGKEKARLNGHESGYVDGIEKYRGNGNGRVGKDLVKNVEAKCSTKWARYGGSVPAMLEALESISDLDEALKPWEMTLTNKERSILLKEQVRWERAMEIFEWFRRKRCYEVNVIHYNIVITILGRARRWGEVERLCGEMRKRGIEPINSTYGTLIDVYSKGGHREKAMKWLEMMNERKIEPDEVTMGIVVQMHKKAGDFQKAEDFFKKWSCSKSVAGECGASTSGRKGSARHDYGSSLCLSSHTYNTLIDTYGKAGKMHEASETLGKMLKEGIMPTTVTFNSMIHMYGNNGQLRKVTSLIKIMEKLECYPDTRTYNILISLHAKHDDIELATRYFTKMKEASLEPDAVSYRILLYAFSIRHMVSEAEELILEMDKNGLEMDEYTQSSLTRMYIEAGLLEKSWSWFLRFHQGGNMTSECYSATIDAFGQRGYVSEAEKVFISCLEEKKLSVTVFNVMIKAYGICEKFEQACCLFDSMQKHCLVPDRCSHNSLVQMLASADLPEKGQLYLRKMQDAGLVIDCIPYCAVISSFAKLGQMDFAVDLYEEMLRAGIKPDVVVYGVLINAFAETGSVKEATYYVNAMTDQGLPMNPVIYKSLIKLYTKVGYLEEAQEAYRALHLLQGVHDTYSSNCMIDLYSERSMVVEAEGIFENMKRNGDANEFTYAMMLCMYKRNGRFVDAFRIARTMRELGFMTDLLSYNHVLGLYASDGRFREAATTFSEMQKSGLQPDDSTFKSLGIILLKCGVPKDAVDKLEQIRKNDSESGLQAWISTLSAVVDVDSDIDVFDDET